MKYKIYENGVFHGDRVEALSREQAVAYYSKCFEGKKNIVAREE